MKKNYLLIFLLFFTTLISQAQQFVPNSNNVLFVKKDATVTGDGSSWTNAIPELADALKWANDNKANFETTPLQIWVAGGTYNPKYSPEDGINYGSDQNRDNSFLMVKNVELYGGFLGNENNLINRDYNANTTILSGDIGIENNQSDNTYHVVVSAGYVGTAKIDGFTITNANADGQSTNRINTFFINRYHGGGIYNYNSSPTITNSTISNNKALYGGGIFSGFSSFSKITNTTIANNKAITGGGIYNYDYSILTITNTTIANNTADEDGAGIFNHSSSPYINNSIIWGNIKSTDQSVSNIHTEIYTPIFFKYSLIQGSMENSYWDSSFGDDGGNNIDENPMFANPATGNFNLTATSPAINAGSNALYGPSVNTDTDLAGNPRLFGTNIDMGALENQQVIISPTNNVLFVKKDATGTGDGSSWTNAIKELADALKWANDNKTNFETTPLQIWVAGGIYNPKYSPEDGLNYGSDQNRDNSFLMVKNVELYGGFLGNENNLIDRDFNVNSTVLSGDIGIENNHTDNTYHVVVSAGYVGTAKIDGFTITNGSADSVNTIKINTSFINRSHGGGIHNSSSSPTITNSIISNNRASYGGGIVNFAVSSPIITKTIISNNVSNQGGGIF